MPLPSKRKDEKQSEFMSRCMSDDIMEKEYKDNKLEQLETDDLNYSFLSKTFASLSKIQKEKILQVLRNSVSLEKTG